MFYKGDADECQWSAIEIIISSWLQESSITKLLLLFLMLQNNLIWKTLLLERERERDGTQYTENRKYNHACKVARKNSQIAREDLIYDKI